jgi:hypothetical protein
MNAGWRSSALRNGLGHKVANDQTAQQRQLSMKEVSDSGNDGHRQGLRASPVHDIGQWHGVVLFTVQHQRARVQFWRNRCDGESARGRADQHQLLRRVVGAQRFDGMACNKCAKRKPGERKWPRIIACSSMGDDGQEVLQLTAPFVVNPLRAPDTPKIKTQHTPAALHKGPSQGLHHFIVHGAAKQRMRVGYDGYAAQRFALCQSWQVFQRLDRTSRALHNKFTGLDIHRHAIF